MFAKLCLGLLLMALCVVIHVTGLLAVLRMISLKPLPLGREFWPSTRWLVLIAAWAVLLHLLQIVIWAVAYTAGGAMEDLATASYFSAVTYTTTGYGDLVPPEEWRLVGSVEALTGILMCGLSTALFFAVFARIVRVRTAADEPG